MLAVMCMPLAFMDYIPLESGVSFWRLPESLGQEEANSSLLSELQSDDSGFGRIFVFAIRATAAIGEGQHQMNREPIVSQGVPVTSDGVGSPINTPAARAVKL